MRGGAEQTPSEARSGTKLHRAPRRQPDFRPVESHDVAADGADGEGDDRRGRGKRRRVSRENTPRRRRTRDSTPSRGGARDRRRRRVRSSAPVEVASTAGAETRPIAAGIARARTTGCRSSGTAPRADSRRTRIISRGSRATGRLWRVRARVRARASGSAGGRTSRKRRRRRDTPRTAPRGTERRGRERRSVGTREWRATQREDAVRTRWRAASRRSKAGVAIDGKNDSRGTVLPVDGPPSHSGPQREARRAVVSIRAGGAVAMVPRYLRAGSRAEASFRRRTSRRRRGRWRPSRPRSSPFGR